MPRWLDVFGDLVSMLFAISATISWAAVLVDCTTRRDLHGQRRALLLVLLYVGNWVGATLYFMFMPQAVAGVANEEAARAALEAGGARGSLSGSRRRGLAALSRGDAASSERRAAFPVTVGQPS